MDVAKEIPVAGDEEETHEAPITSGDDDYDEEMPEAPLFDMDARLEQLVEMLNFECKSTRTIGVVGMPGIGKTTLADKLYEECEGKFRRCVFLRDVRGMWRGNTMDQRNIFMNELLRDDNLNQDVADLSPEAVKAALLSKKSLVVLDNVSEKKQLDVLLEDRGWVASGSRIVITTSDKSVIEGIVDDTYEVPRLSGRDSFQYFNYFAFGSKDYTPEGNFMKLSRQFVDYANGNPFALNRLGVDLHGKNEAHWREKLRDLEENPHKAIQDFLKISYDGLEKLQKDVFLDIACFFRSGDESHVKCLVEESCDTESNIAGVSGIKDLAGKFFINISGGRVEMHDILYTFGKELGSKGSRRLWKNVKDIIDALNNKTVR